MGRRDRTATRTGRKVRIGRFNAGPDHGTGRSTETGPGAGRYGSGRCLACAVLAVRALRPVPTVAARIWNVWIGLMALSSRSISQGPAMSCSTPTASTSLPPSRIRRRLARLEREQRRPACRLRPLRRRPEERRGGPRRNRCPTAPLSDPTWPMPAGPAPTAPAPTGEVDPSSALRASERPSPSKSSRRYSPLFRNDLPGQRCALPAQIAEKNVVPCQSRQTRRLRRPAKGGRPAKYPAISMQLRITSTAVSQSLL